MSSLHVVLPILKLETIEDFLDFILKLYADGYPKRAKSYFNLLTIDEKDLATDYYYRAVIAFNAAVTGEHTTLDYNEFMQVVQAR
ncbi:hypothetical protein [Mucilaginibacter sp. UYCu711]|uniref:hypothetical protein n=1 Tax=Mucilaginibacter sp. UYCu711 TaxID=3156339 RepID=UPI003D1E5688